jgi:hypothetical protein
LQKSSAIPIKAEDFCNYFIISKSPVRYLAIARELGLDKFIN